MESNSRSWGSLAVLIRNVTRDRPLSFARGVDGQEVAGSRSDDLRARNGAHGFREES